MTSPTTNQLMQKHETHDWTLHKTQLSPQINMEATYRRKDGSTLTVECGQNDIPDRLKDFDKRHPIP